MIKCEGTGGVVPGGGARGQYLEDLCTMLRCCVSFSSNTDLLTLTYISCSSDFVIFEANL